jgi:hypothetical protein
VSGFRANRKPGSPVQTSPNPLGLDEIAQPMIDASGHHPMPPTRWSQAYEPPLHRFVEVAIDRHSEEVLSRDELFRGGGRHLQILRQTMP